MNTNEDIKNIKKGLKKEIAKQIYDTPLINQLRQERNTQEVEKAENIIASILDTVSDIDLKMKLDSAIGNLASSYEEQGFILGFKVAEKFPN